MDGRPNDFDWVTARHECSPVAFFEQLRMMAERNAETRNAQLSDTERQAGTRFTCTNGGGSFVVADERTGGSRDLTSVQFTLKGATIGVAGSGRASAVTFSGTLTMTDDAVCRLQVGGDALDPWQVLRRTLEVMFFGPAAPQEPR